MSQKNVHMGFRVHYSKAYDKSNPYFKVWVCESCVDISMCKSCASDGMHGHHKDEIYWKFLSEYIATEEAMRNK